MTQAADTIGTDAIAFDLPPPLDAAGASALIADMVKLPRGNEISLSDINMPRLDGYGVTRAVRSAPAYDATPILVLSTEAEQGSKDIANEVGANGWIVKPFDPEGLIKVINTVCG